MIEDLYRRMSVSMGLFHALHTSLLIYISLVRIHLPIICLGEILKWVMIEVEKK